MPDITVAAGEELVLLLDEDGRAAGTAAKASVHHAETPLHLGFSCYLFNADDRVLVTRRALGNMAGRVDQLVLRPSRTR
jgi:isopentenyl-diphosphate Delta-isomerase